MPVKKIVVIGPESTGKSTLCEDLTAHFVKAGRHAAWVPEYAREYLLSHGMNYRYEDLLTIAKGQIALEDRIAGELSGQQEPAGAGSDRLLFIDTDMYVMKVWCEFVYGNCHPWILAQIAARHYDGYLLCRTDLPWVRDELREYPDPVTREKLFRIYRDAMINQQTPWIEIGGETTARTAAGITAVNRLLSD